MQWIHVVSGELFAFVDMLDVSLVVKLHFYSIFFWSEGGINMFCGIDVSKNKSQVCILDENKEISKEFEITHTKEGFEQLERELVPTATIAMETTGNYSKAIYEYFKERYETIYVDNGLMNMFARLHYSHTKTDKIDARLIAKYLSFGLRQVNPIKDERLKDLARLYEKTCYQMSKYKHMFKNQLNIIFPELETHFFLSKAKGMTSLLIKYPTPEAIARLSDGELQEILKSHYKKGGNLVKKEKFTTTLKELASNSIGIKDYPTDCFTQTLKILQFYEDTIEEIKNRIKVAVMSCPYSRLIDEFGYDDVSLALIVGMVGDIRRFPHYKKFVSYCGFDVSAKQSGKSESKNCYITKRGNKTLRHTFYLATLVYLSHNKGSPHTKFYERLRAKGKHPKQCLTAMARKLAIKTYYDMMRCHANC